MFAVGMTTLTLFGYVIRLGSPQFWVLCVAVLPVGYLGPQVFCNLIHGRRPFTPWEG